MCSKQKYQIMKEALIKIRDLDYSRAALDAVNIANEAVNYKNAMHTDGEKPENVGQGYVFKNHFINSRRR